MEEFRYDLVELKDYVPLFQTILWLVLIVTLLIIYRYYVNKLLKLTINRIKSGSSFKAGPIEVGAKLEKLDYAPQENQLKGKTNNSNREVHRKEIYEKNRGLFITYVIHPSKKEGQAWDIFIYLIKHKSEDLSEIEKAEFFFGHMWGNKIFEEREKNGLIGVKTSAYAPFLCTCFVTMKDKTVIQLDRYIDFEMKYIFQ